MPATDAALTHVYAKAGTYTVDLTCADGDLVNDAANPAACSGKRTTSLKVTVKDAAKLTLAAPTRVKAGKSRQAERHGHDRLRRRPCGAAADARPRPAAGRPSPRRR